MKSSPCWCEWDAVETYVRQVRTEWLHIFLLAVSSLKEKTRGALVGLGLEMGAQLSLDRSGHGGP